MVWGLRLKWAQSSCLDTVIVFLFSFFFTEGHVVSGVCRDDGQLFPAD
jgi:hypothetical protein